MNRIWEQKKINIWKIIAKIPYKNLFSGLNPFSIATLEHQNFSNFFHGQLAKNESNKCDFNEALEHNLEGKKSEKDRVSPKKAQCWLCWLT